MAFQLHPMLSAIAELYEMPRGAQRFEAYLALLQTEGGDDLAYPIMGYNPMAKDQAPAQLQALIHLDAEAIAQQALHAFNATLPPDSPDFTVVLNLADDLQGAWTHRAATAFASCFQILPLIHRQFCAPYLWTSETYTEAQIHQLVSAYACRTWYQHQYGAPKTLTEHLNQEVYVQQQFPNAQWETTLLSNDTADFYQQHQNDTEYALMFNFFYGDEASAQLGYPCFGRHAGEGFAYAAHQARS